MSEELFVIVLAALKKGNRWVWVVQKGDRFVVLGGDE